ncbi:tripartite tricarboxylate transporter permease [Candidatus Woesearchaeota archaeon]|nr:tripartite tricarboxylate transporter permease [Candidatus Woesearchaeota archaeon]
MAFIEVAIALFGGILIGIVTGIAPGIHINLVSVLVVASAPFLLQFTSALSLVVFIISLAITHTFLDTLPTIYLGAPDEAQALNVLPGHRLLMQGLGHSAVLYTILGSLGSLLLGIILFPIFIWSMIRVQPLISSWIGYLLIFIMAYMILREKKKKLASLVAFLLAGSLGLLVFSIPHLHQPLFPLLSGLFGVSLLLLSFMQKSIIPPQKVHQPLTISRKNTIKSVSAASGMGFIAAFLPGFGSSQAAIIGTQVVGEIGDEGFLSLVGGINTANMVISIATAYALDKARNGAIVAVNQLMDGITFSQMLVFLAVSLVAGGIATIAVIYLSKIFARLIVKVNYQQLILVIIFFIISLTFYFDGFMGLVILGTATSIGVVASAWGVGKNHLMGCLILPVILYFVL